MKICIIGSSAAGFTAAFELRKLDKNTEITVIDKAKKGYSPCCLPYVIGGEIKEKDIFVVKEEDYKQNNIKLINSTVKIIDKKKKQIILEDGSISEYDKLIIATGSKTFIPPINGLDKVNFYTLKTLENERKISKEVQKEKKAVIIGGGWIGIEVADALAERGMKVTILEAKDRIISALIDTEITGKIKQILQEKKIEILEKVLVKEVQDKKVILENKEINYDMLFVITGMKPNIQLAKETGLKVDKGIIVNERLRTSDKNIYACGDCVELKQMITKEQGLSMLGSIAVKAGRTVAKNIMGVKEEFPEVLNAAVSKIGEFYLGRIGITEEQAKQRNLKYVSSLVNTETKAEYCPERKKITIKMISDRKGNILGCQILGEEEVAPRINLMSSVMSKRMRLSELTKLETCYNPMSAPMFEPLSIAAEICVKKIEQK